MSRLVFKAFLGESDPCVNVFLMDNVGEECLRTLGPSLKAAPSFLPKGCYVREMGGDGVIRIVIRPIAYFLKLIFERK